LGFDLSHQLSHGFFVHRVLGSASTTSTRLFVGSKAMPTGELKISVCIL
jgi:hypothetical protein